MVSIVSKNSHVEFPIYGGGSRFFKNRIFDLTFRRVKNHNLPGIEIIKAIKGVSFSISHGDRVGIIGKNGSGKSTLLKLLSGIYPPSMGNIKIVGKVNSLIDISFGIEPDSTGYENIFLRGALLGLSKQHIQSKVNEIIEFSELENFINLPVKIYSSGMQLKLAFSIITILTPDILIMDEWLSVGDERFKKKAEIKLMELVNKSKILIMASHSKELIERVCNRVMWIEDGKIKMEGSAKIVCNAYFEGCT